MDAKQVRLRQIIVVLGIIFVSFSFYAYQIVMSPNIQRKDKDGFIYIPSGATFATVLDSLKKNDQISDVTSFAFMAKMMGYQEKVKAGKYKLKKNSSNMQVLRMLRNGAQDPISLTFNNIRLKRDFLQKVGERFEFKNEALDSLLSSSEYTAKFDCDTTNIVGIFIPNSYQFYWNISAEDFVEKMFAEYNKFWNEERNQKLAQTGYTRKEVVIIASIVEAETQKTDEKSRIAGVYINRLKSGMPLQADPTVKFAVGDFTLKRILSGHTKVNSPYNTYKNKGLPPGPINIPSAESVDAVLSYEKHPYYFFCASPDRIGYHDFAENFNEHLKLANKYREFLDKINVH